MKFQIEAEVQDWIEDEVVAKSRKEAVKKFRDEYRTDFPSVRIMSINNVEVIGYCESCSLPILAGESRGPYSDVDMCSECMKEGEPDARPQP